MEKIKSILLVLLLSKYISELKIFIEPLGTGYVAMCLFALMFYIKIAKEKSERDEKDDSVCNDNNSFKYSIFTH